MALAGPYVIQSRDAGLANRWLGATPNEEPPLVVLRAEARDADVWVVTPLVESCRVIIIHQRSGLCLARSAANFGVCIVEPLNIAPLEISRQVWVPDEVALGTFTVGSLMDDNAFMTPGPLPGPLQLGVQASPGEPSKWIFVKLRE